MMSTYIFGDPSSKPPVQQMRLGKHRNFVWLTAKNPLEMKDEYGCLDAVCIDSYRNYREFCIGCDAHRLPHIEGQT